MTQHISICWVPQYWEEDKTICQCLQNQRSTDRRITISVQGEQKPGHLYLTALAVWLRLLSVRTDGRWTRVGSGRASPSYQHLHKAFDFCSGVNLQMPDQIRFSTYAGVIQFHSHPCDTILLPRLAGACNAAVTLSLVSGQLFTPPEGTLQEPHASSPSKPTTPGITDVFLMHRSPDCPGVPHPQTSTMNRSGGTVYYLVSSRHVFTSVCSCKIYVFCRLIGLMYTFICIAVFFFFLRHSPDSTELCFCTFNDSVSVTLQKWAARPCSPDRLGDPAMSLFPAPRWPGMKLCIHVAVREPIFSVCRSPISIPQPVRPTFSLKVPSPRYPPENDRSQMNLSVINQLVFKVLVFVQAEKG